MYGINKRLAFPKINLILFWYLPLKRYNHPYRNPEMKTNIDRSMLSRNLEHFTQRDTMGP